MSLASAALEILNIKNQYGMKLEFYFVHSFMSIVEKLNELTPRWHHIDIHCTGDVDIEYEDGSHLRFYIRNNKVDQIYIDKAKK